MGSSQKPLAHERRLTRSQHEALDVLENEHRLTGNLEAVAVVGWDTSVSGPLVALDRFDPTSACVAITPRGKSIPRERIAV